MWLSDPLLLSRLTGLSTVTREPLINSESFSCVGKMPERRTRSAGPVQIKARIADKTQSIRCAHGASFSKAIVKIGKAYRILLSPLTCVPAGDAAMRRSELDGPALRHFNKQMLIHEFIRGSLITKLHADTHSWHPPLHHEAARGTRLAPQIVLIASVAPAASTRLQFVSDTPDRE